MITNKEDLIGTYIKNDNGELRELYIAVCEEFLVAGTPKDLMMSNDKWLGPNAGCKFIGVYEGGMWIGNNCCSDDKEIQISDLKPIPTETPEEKEALDAIERVEWNGEGLPPIGAECEYKDGHNWYEVRVKYLSEWFMVIEALKSQSKLINIKGTELSFDYSRFDSLKFRKPETPQQKLERERLEAAYDLYISWLGDRAYNDAIKFDEWKVEPNFYKKWLRIVDKTNYRKGE